MATFVAQLAIVGSFLVGTTWREEAMATPGAGQGERTDFLAVPGGQNLGPADGEYRWQ